MKRSPLEQKLITISEPVLKDLGYDLIWLDFKSGILQILAENPKTGNLSLDDCTAISKVLSPVLEVEDPISGAYTLEVSSPGIDRPLVRPEDFRKFLGFEAKVELDEAIEGRKRFRGLIRDEKDGTIVIETDTGNATLDLNDVRKARLVLSDELIKALKPPAPPQTEQTN